MTFRFADFELDEARRELRLQGREIGLQPRVFDLLCYLIRHRDRVVTKEELLDALWPDTVVVEGALQRVVSLARSALQKGDARDAIRTHARHGYRFSGEVLSDMDGGSEEPTELIERARWAFGTNDWDAAIASFNEADDGEALSAADLENLAFALQWAGRSGEAVPPLERAVAAHLSRKDRQGAARAAWMLAQIQFERLDMPVARAWHRRAESYLRDDEHSREFGLCRYLGSRIALMDGELELALDYAQTTLGLGRQLEDPDLEVLGLLYTGHALLSLGDVEAGIASQDEAAAAVLAGEVSPWIGGLIYCGVIWACRNRGDWDRAAKWTEHFQRWCDRNALAAFPGTCRLHRAEVLSIRGDLDEARKEIVESSELLSNWAPWAEGDAYRILGDLMLACGNLDEAEDAFARAHERGWDPQPGYGLLQLARNNAEAAMRGLELSLADRNWANRERRGLLLAAFAVAAVRAGAQQKAMKAIEELDMHPDLWSTPLLEGVVSEARAELAYSSGRLREAIILTRHALDSWRKVPSPLRTAGLQLRLAEFLTERGDQDAARLELSAAEQTFAEAGAPKMIEKCRALRPT
jgi:DNA-binding winged helix-turn-helix (wHTH) protein